MPNCLYLPAWLQKKKETCTRCHELGFVCKLKSRWPCPGERACLPLQLPAAISPPRVLLTLGPARQTHFASCLLLHPWLRKLALLREVCVPCSPISLSGAGLRLRRQALEAAADGLSGPAWPPAWGQGGTQGCLHSDHSRRDLGPLNISLLLGFSQLKKNGDNNTHSAHPLQTGMRFQLDEDVLEGSTIIKLPKFRPQHENPSLALSFYRWKMLAKVTQQSGLMTSFRVV